MYFANPWGLLGLLSLPVIGVIHLYQRRFPPLLVAGSHLWGADVRIQTAGRRRDRLPVTSSLLLELLAGTIFSLALAHPRIGEMGAVTHHIVVLDDSASMSAEPVGQPSFRDAALAEIDSVMTQGDRDSRITLIRTGRQPTLLGSRAMTRDEARAALADWQPQSPRHDFESAWDEAAQLIGPGGQFLFLTDRLPDESTGLPQSMQVVSVGRPLPNVSIDAARWLFDSQTNAGRLYVRIANLGSEATDVRVTAMRLQPGTDALPLRSPVFEQSFRVPAHGSLPLETSLPGGLGQLEVEIAAADDGLRLDDRVVLVEPKVRMFTLAVTLPESSVERQLVERVLPAIPDLQTGEPSQANLIIGPAGTIPESRGGLWWLGIGPINASPVVREQARDLIGPYLIEKQHPLMEGIVLGGVVWGGVQPTDLVLLPLVSAGRMQLLGRLENTQTTAFLMNIDLARSNLGESPDWPILMTNLCELCRDELPGLRRWNYQLNENIRFRVPPKDEATADEPSRTLTLLEPDGGRRTLVRDRNDLVEITRLDEPGIYVVQDNETTVGEFAVGFHDPEESSLAQLAAGKREAHSPGEVTRLSVDDPWSWLMALAALLLLAVVLADWWILRPRASAA